MGGPEAPVSPKVAAVGIVDQLLAAQLAESGTFRDYLGQPMGWLRGPGPSGPSRFLTGVP
jgi:hypothetical protein